GSVDPPTYYVAKFTSVFPWIVVAGLALWCVYWLLENRVEFQREDAYRVIRIGPRKPRSAPGMDAFLWFWLAVTLAYFSSITHKELRYILPLAPPVLLLAGRGLAVLLRPRAVQARVVGGAVLAGALALTFAPVMQ